MQSSLVVVCAALLLAVAHALPAAERYVWVPDGDGNLHMVDLLAEDVETEDEGVEPFFNGDSDVTLKLYTLNNPSSFQTLDRNDDSSAPNYDGSKPTRFVIHGWLSKANTLDDIRQAYMTAGLDYNVIMVDWGWKALGEYSVCKRNSRRVGEYVAVVANYLVARRGASLDNIWVIGHSLGGQAAGVAGNRLNGDAACIVGLDAAAPLFGTTSLANKLDPTDGKIVQGLHTNGGLLGWKDPLGHVDFFPNGGGSQAGCILDLAGTCSHNLAPPFYAESILSRNFVGTQCGSYRDYTRGNCDGNPTAVMGEWTAKDATGSFWYKTNSKSPYGQG